MSSEAVDAAVAAARKRFLRGTKPVKDLAYRHAPCRGRPEECCVVGAAVMEVCNLTQYDSPDYHTLSTTKLGLTYREHYGLVFGWDGKPYQSDHLDEYAYNQGRSLAIELGARDEER